MTLLTPTLDSTVWMRAFAAAVGNENVITSDSPELDAYVDPYAFHASAVPAGVVRPSTVEEVQQVLAIAREHSIPLWTVSRGRNLAYGGSEARVPGSVVVDLGRMDRVISVDEQTGVAILEPGVSFQALDAHLRATGSRFAVSVPDLSWGSVLGNTLERGFSYTTQSEHQAVQCGMEVVLADGDVLRTGMGGLPGSGAWANYRGSFGPGFDGLFFQSNFGIVTKMGVWLRKRPERMACCSISVPDDSQLGVLVETLRELMLDGTIQSNAVIGNAMIVTSSITERARFYNGQGLMPEEALQDAIDEFHLGRWNAQLGVYGSPALLAARIEAIEDAVLGIPGATIEFAEYAGDVDPVEVRPEHRTQLGVPANEAIAMVAWRGGHPAHSDIGLVCEPTADAVDRLRALVGPRVEAAGLDFTVGFMLWPRHVVAMTLVTFDKSDATQASAVGELIGSVIAAAAAAGFGIYRSHVTHMDVAAEQYSFNDHAARRFAGRIKSALDPHGILSPGKQGIWPAR
ncbi:MAG: FAD-binding oxidoreductase [Actinomycetota bacterium]|nr:FAD-binding oxidoreductase [Actinomycetota bacterium]